MTEEENKKLDILIDYLKDVHERLVDIYELLTELSYEDYTSSRPKRILNK